MLDPNQINALANEITKTYMAGKNMLGSDAFVNEYLDFFEKTVDIITRREKNKQTTEAETKNDYSALFR